MDIYKFAAQNCLRFSSSRGSLSVENLFQLDLDKARDGCDLNTIGLAIKNQLKTLGEDSLVETKAENPAKKALEVALEIVKDVIKTKQEAAAAAEQRQHKMQLRMKLLDAIDAKENEKLTTASIDDLKKQLEALEAA